MKKLIPIFIVLLLCGCSGQNKITEYSDTRFLMDTICTIQAGGPSIHEAIPAAFDRISEIAAATDYFSDNSELSTINRASAGETVALSDDMFNILKTALDICEKSGGAFDITVGPLKDAWNFSADNPSPPAENVINDTLSRVDFGNLSLDEENKTLTKATSECKIDLGAAAKGYAADCAAAVLKERGCAWAIIDLGGNIYVFGENPNRNSGSWVVGIQEPFADSGEYFTTTYLSEGAVVTAGVYQRYFEYEGKIYHHLLDPKTGFPADNGLASATIKAESALAADCLSTACLILGKEDGSALAREFGAELIVR